MGDGAGAATERADVVVVGARCAGAATAATLARAGRRVIVLDSARFPSDTLSTHLLWPSGVAELARLGALTGVAELGAPPLNRAFAGGAGHAIATAFPAVDGIDYAMCVRRAGMDQVLVRTARTAGAEIRERCRVTEIVWDGTRCAGVRYADAGGAAREIKAHMVVGADGRRSTVARLVGAERPFAEVPSGRDCYFAYWRDDATSWRRIAAQWRAGADLGTAFPCDGGLLLCLVQPPADPGPLRPGEAERRYTAAVERLPELGARLSGCERVGRVRSATGLSSYFRHSAGPGWALPGDAGHFKDPVTAQGIRDALHYGRLLGEAVVPVLDDPARLDRAVREWERRRVRECREIYHWTNRLARGEAMRPLEIELYRTATRHPELGELVTGIFSRTRRPAELNAPVRTARLVAGALWRGRHDPVPVVADVARQVRDNAAEWVTTHTALRADTPPIVPSLAAPGPRSTRPTPVRSGEDHA
ncbi:NAD(P)/FAD-dependent oxidoreductase [Nocardia blacklockiae]|uniref:NAD(P)/FAD-dependent oxidoreductase n=1 Tax=Nocardia blacklockiae TaxID=480036 RepID=UPI001895771F|nr:FAD-dependent monooxygenase [Nocardia blacklockiae]MBF6170298.1 FAD-dependent monooxygenase [Nocardia blacklockiae]